MTERATITSLVQEAGWKQERVAEFRRAVAKSKENRLPLADISNYQSAPRPGQPRKLTIEHGDEICEWVTSCKAHRDMQAWEVIAKLGLDISDSLLFQTMYDRGYSRKKHGWKPLLSTLVKKHRKKFALKYVDFYWKGEISIHIGEMQSKL